MPSYITHLTGGGSGYFADQFGTPRLFWADEAWGLPENAGRWNGGDWALEYDTYFAARGAQGFTALVCHPWGHTHTGCNNSVGNTWDGVSPWSGGVPNLNDTFWQRIDYMFSSAAASGITVFFDLTMGCDNDRGSSFAGTGVWHGVADADITAAAQNIAARYLATPNLVWMYGDDTNSSDEPVFDLVLAGIQAAGDGRDISVEYYPTGTTSREDLSGTPTDTPFPWGAANATFNYCYYYWVTYFAVEQAYKENNQIPPVWGDGYFWGGESGTDVVATANRTMRMQAWWALASGARGCTMGSHFVWNWPSAAQAAVTNEAWYVNSTAPVRAVIESLTGWNKLLPDLTNALVTAGRGTRAAYNTGNWSSDTGGNYVAASRVPDGSLALLYLPAATTITIDQTKMAAGYSAKWIDPLTGATSVAATGPTYNSTAKGANSGGDPDWGLALFAPPYATWTVP